METQSLYHPTSRIKPLSAQEAQKIAAGQVVERPANIVKELIENSLDAGANQITLFIEDGGKKLIRVVDNGCGMSLEDARICFQNHTTSKITNLNDLETLTTFGFRGEALASICAVSKIRLITKEKGAIQGHSLELESRSIVKTTTIGCPLGTDISVQDLFYNVPARKKFLKTRETEWRQILGLFQALCLANHTLHFKLFSEDKLILNCPPVQTIEQRIAQLWDNSVSHNMIPVKAIEHDVTLTGALSNHTYFRYDRNHIFLFVNNRWIKNQKLINALLKGYINVLPPGRFPVAALFIKLDQSQVDINIHPRKEEVQFLHPRRVELLISTCAKSMLEQHVSHYLQKQDFPSMNPQLAFSVPTNQPNRSLIQHHYPVPEPKSFNPPLFTVKQELIPEPQPRGPSDVIPLADTNLSIKKNLYSDESDYRLIGQFKKTYLLLEREDGLFLIDQHAAHERILYEKFSHHFKDLAPVNLIFPQIINLSAQDIATLQPHFELFRSNGIIIDLFGENQIKIESTPVHLKGIALNELVQEIIALIYEYQSVEKTEFHTLINKKMHAQMACKAAVKAGDILTIAQMEQLITDLNQVPNRFSCPHGRPTGWLLDHEEIEKKFKRKL